MNFCPLNVGKKQNKTPPNKIRLKAIFTKNQNVFKIFVQNEKNYRFAVTKLKKNLPFFGRVKWKICKSGFDIIINNFP